MDLYEALYTTRAMRRLKPDPIPYDVQTRILDAAIRAPTPGNSQAWRFLLVDDPVIKQELARLYQESQLWAWPRTTPHRQRRPVSQQRKPSAPMRRSWVPPSTSPNTGQRRRSSFSGSSVTMPRATPSFPPSGARCSRRGRSRSAAPLPRSFRRSGQPRRWHCSACRRTRGGRWWPAFPWDTQRGAGESPRGGRWTRLPPAIAGMAP